MKDKCDILDFGSQVILISHQILKGNDIKLEKELALHDLKNLFAPHFERECEVLTVRVFSNGWPVNRAIQGKDINSEGSLKRLYLVGDGCKPPGYVMTEGVAKSVENVVKLIKASQEV